jgi:ABC-type Fe3+/spermidine/putrescine transport system ATPase subunit
MSIAETVAVMRDGRVEQAGTPEEVYLRPASRWMAAFLGMSRCCRALPGRARELRAGTLPAGDVSGAWHVLVCPKSS